MLSILPTVAFLGLNIALACDTQEEYEKHTQTPYSSHRGLGSIVESVDNLTSAANLTLLPQTAGNESPACLDGSPYGFYFVPSTTGSKQWTISIVGKFM